MFKIEKMKHVLLGVLWIVSVGSVGIVTAEVKHSDQDKSGDTSQVIVFVDVSGSMKLNDPNNMRAPAIRMLSGMAPEYSKVGIFLFGTTVRELVSFEQVNESWKQKAESGSKRYQSRDLYTNIESALKYAEGIFTQKENTNRSIILLTDGIVDIDKNPAVSNRSRERILNSVLQQLQQQQIKVHTIALSQNADRELLEELALATDGQHHQVDNADLLQRTFLNLFEQSAPQDTIPLSGNKITIDESISELTLLVFKKPGAKPTQVRDPSGSVYTEHIPVPGFKWKHDTGYDLISIEKPMPGQWQLIADVDPDNRAMIVTDLKMKTDEIPSNVLNGEEIKFTMWLEESGDKIDRSDFLKLVNASLITNLPTGEQLIKPLDGPNDEGYIQYQLGPDWQDGSFELIFRVDSETFIREKRFNVTSFQTPITVDWIEQPVSEITAGETTPLTEDKLETEPDFIPDTGWVIQVNAVPEVIDMQQSELIVEITSQQGITKQLSATQLETGWQINFIPFEAGQNTLSIVLNTTSISGREISIQEPPIELGAFLEAKPVIEEPVEKPLAYKHIIIPVVIGNIVFVLIFFLWRFYRGLRQSAYTQPEEAL